MSHFPLPIVERSQEEIAQTIRSKVQQVGGVTNCSQVSVRIVGKRYDVDIDVSLVTGLGFEDVHKIVSNVERAVKRLIPNARVTVRTEAFGGGREEVWRLVKEVAEKVPGSRGVHNIHLQMVHGKICVDLHLEVSANMTVKQAHDVSDQVERELKAANPGIGEIIVHMESASDLISRELAGGETELKWNIEHLAAGFPEIRGIHAVRIRKIGDSLHLELRCLFDPNINMEQAHEISSRLEKEIKNAYPKVDRIDIHEEPS